MARAARPDPLGTRGPRVRRRRMRESLVPPRGYLSRISCILWLMLYAPDRSGIVYGTSSVLLAAVSKTSSCSALAWVELLSLTCTGFACRNSRPREDRDHRQAFEKGNLPAVWVPSTSNIGKFHLSPLAATSFAESKQANTDLRPRILFNPRRLDAKVVN